MKLNQTLLSIICAVQDCKKFEVSKLFLECCRDEDTSLTFDWHKNVKKYFHSIDKILINKAGIKKNNITFERILDCKLPDEVYNTEYCDLGKFEVLI